ncbi:MAG: WYL domain-containing protein [Flavobacteriales bacterium]|nr:WYL domain-containing protein [Flavobacteriales bacterium]
MSHRGKLKRYLLLLERLQHAPSLNDLLDHMQEHGFRLSSRTLQRDLNDLRDEFGAQVIYDRTTNTYAVAEDLVADMPGLLQLLERGQLLDLVHSGNKGMAELHRHVHFEGLGQLRGIQHLPPLLRAIRERRAVEVTYRKFHADKAKTYRLHPHLLKESQGRWHVLGPTTQHGHPIALGLDRIEGLQVLPTRFTRKEIELATLYDHTIGVDTSPGRPERIVLLFNATQAQYIEALPLHPSQQVEQKDKNGTVISLFVMPNFELRQIILSMGASVRVLEPMHLAKAIRQAHRDAAALYGK